MRRPHPVEVRNGSTLGEFNVAAPVQGSRSIGRWVILVVMSALYFFVYFHRISPAVLAVDLKRAFHIDTAALSFLSSAYFYLYAALQIPVGILTDTWGPRKVATASTGLAFIGSLLFALAPNFATATFARLLVGAGVSGVYVPTLKVMGNWFSGRHFATITGMVIAAGNLGGLVATSPLVWATDHWGWRNVLLAISGVTLVLGLLCWLLVRDEPARAGRRPGEPVEWRGYLRLASRALQNRSLWKVGVCGFGKYGPLMAYQGLWGAMFLMSVYGLTKVAAGNVLMVISIGYAAGGPLLGFLSDRVFHSRRLILATGVTSFALAWLPLIFRPGNLNVWELYLISLVMGIAGGGTGVLIFSMAKEAVEPELSGMAIAAVNTASFAAVVLFQPLTGWIIAHSQKVAAQPIASYRTALLVCALGSAIAAFTAWLVPEHLAAPKTAVNPGPRRNQAAMGS
ncbi:MAG: MFS transporter [Methanocella sp.]